VNEEVKMMKESALLDIKAQDEIELRRACLGK